MDEEKLSAFRPDQSKKQLMPITYTCAKCSVPKTWFQPYPTELANTDFRQWCWSCKQITSHQRILLKE